jgi:hypothetical protein
VENKKTNEVNVSFSEKEDFLLYLCDVSNKKNNNK